MGLGPTAAELRAAAPKVMELGLWSLQPLTSLCRAPCRVLSGHARVCIPGPLPAGAARLEPLGVPHPSLPVPHEAAQQQCLPHHAALRHARPAPQGEWRSAPQAVLLTPALRSAPLAAGWVEGEEKSRACDWVLA